MDGPLFDAMLKTALEEALRQDAEEAAGRVPRPSVKHRKRMRSLLAGSWKPVRWAAALALAAFGCREPVLENILYEGLPLVQRIVFAGRWEQVKKQKIWRKD